MNKDDKKFTIEKLEFIEQLINEIDPNSEVFNNSKVKIKKIKDNMNDKLEKETENIDKIKRI